MTLIQRFIQALTSNGFKGDSESSLGHRVAYSSDNSPYFIAPELILYPKDHDDMQRILFCLKKNTFHSLSLTMRGGGTGTNGQSLNSGIICDVTRYMNQILSIDFINETVRVQPGVVLDDLNNELSKHGYFFPPNVSPSNRATLGGMINTDAAGKGSKRYGKTSQYVRLLQCLTINGDSFLSTSPDISNLPTVLEGCLDSEAKVLIQECYKDQSRFLTGYNLKPYISQMTDITPLMCGSEGTLAVITEAELSIKRVDPAKGLLIVSVTSMIDFLSVIPELDDCLYDAIEMLDETLLMRASNAGLSSWEEYVLGLSAHPEGVFYIEFSGTTDAVVMSSCDRCKELLSKKQCVSHMLVVSEASELKKCWTIRKNAVGTLSQPGVYKRPVSGMEDIVVPVESLPGVVKTINDIMASYNREYGLYGHVDVGCLHLRPSFDLRHSDDVDVYQLMCDDLFEMVKSVGGIFWGEHSKGLRNAYMKSHFPEPLINIMQDIKACFDSDHRLNPWKIVPPSPIIFNPLLVTEHLFQATREIGIDESSAFYCNGNGVCQSVSRSDIMCPTVKPNRSQVHSPRGRALALKEWTISKLSLTKEDRFSIKSILDGCISCKACKTKCPVHVDIAAQKAIFNHDYYKDKKRPFRHTVLRYAETILPFASLFPLYRQIGMLLGFRNLPHLKPLQVKRWCKKHQVRSIETHQNLENTVIIMQDFFTTFVEPSVFQDTVRLLKALERNVVIIPFQPSWKASHLLGYLDEFKLKAFERVHSLKKWEKLSVPIIGIEPSTTLMFQDEYKEAVSETVNVKLINDYLRSCSIPVKSKVRKSYVLIQHCHEQALLSSQEWWVEVFDKFGQTLRVVTSPCCGMAGFYGLEKENVATSKEIYQSAFETHIHQWPDSELLLTGASCRAQVERFSHRSLRHPIQVLAELI